jgi:hypothetical protein
MYVVLPFLISVVTNFHSFLYITWMGITCLLRRSNNSIVLGDDKYHQFIEESGFSGIKCDSNLSLGTAAANPLSLALNMNQ